MNKYKRAEEHARRVGVWITEAYGVRCETMPQGGYYPCDLVTLNSDGTVRNWVEVKDRRYSRAYGNWEPQSHLAFPDYVIPFGKVATLLTWCQPLRNSAKFVYEYHDAWAVWKMPYDFIVEPPLSVRVFERTDRGLNADRKPHLYVPRDQWQIVEKPPDEQRFERTGDLFTAERHPG